MGVKMESRQMRIPVAGVAFRCQFFVGARRAGAKALFYLKEKNARSIADQAKIAASVARTYGLPDRNTLRLGAPPI